MLVILDDNDMQVIYDFATISNNDPCRNCTNATSCCGCLTKERYINTHNSVLSKYKYLCEQWNSEIINKYVLSVERLIKSYKDLIKFRDEYVSNKKNLSTLCEPLLSYVEKFLTKEDCI